MATPGYKPKHVMPQEFMIDGIPMAEIQTPIETLNKIKMGEGPDYEVMVVSYPRSGTARIVEMAWLCLHDADVETAKNVEQTGRHLFLDLCDPTFTTCYGGKPQTANHKIAKTHLPFHFLEKHVAKKGKKFIVGMRNPKDNIVSLYHFYRMNKAVGLFQGSFTKFFNDLVKHKYLMYGDVNDFNISWWTNRDKGNMLFVHYEDISEDPVRELKRIAEFLEVQLTPEKIERIIQWTTFGNMKNEKSTNYTSINHVLLQEISPYMRKGTVGDWRNNMSAEESQYVEDDYQKRCVPVGLIQRFDI